MKRNILGVIWVMGVLSFAGFCLSSCTSELDVQQAYDFSLQQFARPKGLIKGDKWLKFVVRSKRKAILRTHAIRFAISNPMGRGELRLEDGTLLSPNDHYVLMQKDSVCITLRTLPIDRRLMCMWKIFRTKEGVAL